MSQEDQMFIDNVSRETTGVGVRNKGANIQHQIGTLYGIGNSIE
jgi:hypothetical protein